MADKEIPQLTEFPGTGPVPTTAKFVARDLTTGLDYFVPADRLPVPTVDPAEVTVQQLFALLKQGTGITITTDAGKVVISSTLTTAPAPDQPAAPTNGVVNDVLKEFTFKVNPLYPSYTQYKESGRPSTTQAAYLSAATAYQVGDTVHVTGLAGAGKLSLAYYVAGSGLIPDGKPLLNQEAFTGVSPSPSGTLTPGPTTGSASLYAYTSTAY